MSKIKEFLKLFKLSDLFLAIGFVPFIFFLINGQELMQQSTGKIEVGFPIWIYIIFFVIIMVSWGYYLFFEFKDGYKPKRYVTIIFIFLMFYSMLVVFIQPAHFSKEVICRVTNDANQELFPGIVVGDTVTIEFTYDIYHYLFFAMYVTSIVVFIYIGLFIFPKRFTGVSFIKYLTYGFYIFLLILIISGYIMEYKNYLPFIQSLTSGDKNSVIIYAVKSFIIHRNAYGMCMLMGIIFTCINHALDHKWWYYLILAFLYINLFFSWCITSLMIGALFIGIYVLYRLISTIKEHKKRNTTILISVGGILVIALGLFGLAYVTKGKVLGKLYSIINSVLGGGNTLDFRSYIWDNIFLMLRDGWWIIGRGFGMFNVALLPMNKVNGDIVFPAHSSFMNVLAEGGIIYLFAYMLFTTYLIYIIVQCIKKNPGLTIAMSFGVVAFTIYGLVEAIEYLVYVFAFPLLIYYYSLYPEKKKEAGVN